MQARSCPAGSLLLARAVLLSILVASSVPAAEPCARFPFSEVAASSGVEFRHLNGAQGGKHLPETMGSGAAWLDFDGDGWLDLYLVQSGDYPPSGGAEAANRLYRNLGGGSFTALEGTGTEDRGYGQGVLSVDLNGDGWLDLYITNVGPDTLLHNRGGKSFVGVPLPPPPPDAINWASSTAAADADGDGALDLYVVRYIDFDPEAEIFCGNAETGVRDYCDPSIFVGQDDRYLRNRGDGTFADATAALGFAGARGRGLGVVFTDLDDDSAPDIYVTNDLNLNLLYRNRGDGSFEDLTLLSGSAVSMEGRPEAGMGVGVGDFDGDGDPDLAVSNFDVETNTLYLNNGELFFEDVSAMSGFGLPSFNLLGFGLVIADYDRDSHLDVFIANGHIYERPKRENVLFRQPNLLLAGDGRGAFEVQQCAWLEADPRVSRGAAGADFDNDGDIDLVVMNNDAETILLRNEARTGGWLGIELLGRPLNTGAVGAKAVVESEEGRQVRWLLAGQSYQSSPDPRLFFGLGDSEVTAVEVNWPSGKRLRFLSPPTGRYLRFAEAGSPSE